MPPLPRNVVEYPVPVAPDGIAVVKIVRVEMMFNGSDARAVWPLFIRVTETVKEPLTVGVPESTPPAERVMPVGRPPVAVQLLYGGMPPVAASVVAG